MRTIRWGIIGCGDVTEVKSGPGFQKAEHSSLVAVMRRNGALARDYAQRHAVPKWYDDAAALIHDPDVDAVYIATPPAAHKEYTLMSAQAGKPVYVEKPMALNAQDATAVAAAARAKDLLVMVGHTHLFSPAYRSLKLRGAALGEVRATRSRAGNRGPVRADASVLWDWGPHDVAMCIDLFGALPTKIEAVRLGTLQLPDGRGEEIGLRLEFDGGRQADIRISNIEAAKQRSFEASCANGQLLYDDLADHKLLERRSARERFEPVSIDPSLPLTNLVREFVDSIAASARAHPSLALGAQVVEVLSRCEEQLCA